MTLHYSDDAVELHHGDCLDVLRSLSDCSVDAVVCDPPYGLSATDHGHVIEALTHWLAGDRAFTPNVGGGFMGKSWDNFVPPPAVWDECFRVLKPGGHLLAFAGSRTHDLMSLSIRLAGFEKRDSLAWLYGSGFPKSLDVSKAIDKARDDRPDVARLTARLADLAEAAGITRADIDGHMGTSDMGGWWLSRLAHRAACPSVDNWTRLRDFIPGAHDLDAEVWRLNGRKGTPGEAWDQREVVGQGYRVDHKTGAVPYGSGTPHGVYDLTAPATPDAERWQGWGTALKPAFEPIVMGRKPLAGTVAGNVLAYGTGALNVGGCRVRLAADEDADALTARSGGVRGFADQYVGGVARGAPPTDMSKGRWPANVLLDQSQAAALDAQSGTLTSGANPTRRGSDKFRDAYGDFAGQAECVPARGADSGGASRFFPTFRYSAKAPTSERPRVKREGGQHIEQVQGNRRICSLCGKRPQNVGTSACVCPEPDFIKEAAPEMVAHPTVKPLDLMRWLVRLVTPPGGVVLEPFAGSGTTAEACVLEGFRCIAVEREADYLPLIVQRLSKPLQPGLGIDFGDGAA